MESTGKLSAKNLYFHVTYGKIQTSMYIFKEKKTGKYKTVTKNGVFYDPQ
jgi:hypothetical protein